MARFCGRFYLLFIVINLFVVNLMPAAMNKSNGYHNEAFEMHPESQVNNNCLGLCKVT